MKRKSLFFAIFVLLLSAPAAFAQAANEPYRVIYALAAPFMTLTDEVSFSDLRAYWDGSSPDTNVLVKKILIGSSSEADLRQIFGCAPSARYIQTVSSQSLIDRALSEDDWALIPFEMIEPRWKILRIDGDSVISNSFNADTWPLTARRNAGDSEDIDWSRTPISNRNADKLTTMILTGVTAMVRATSDYMDAISPLYPASLIREPLIAADILHVNNEVPFAKKCTQTQEQLDTLHFCSKPVYMDLLTDIGTDVVELDGDHFQDFGDEAVSYTLGLYQEAGIPYYGGGKNREEAQQPLILTHHGNRFGFIGCNGKEKGYAAASETRPGAVHCNIPLIERQVRELKNQGIIPIVTFQHIEVYQDLPTEPMIKDFESVFHAGAVIVSGSQSHIPMKFDLYQNSFIHYGLGNLFFDQAFFLPETATATLDRHVFYDGHYISTEFLTIRFTNCALSHYMDEADRDTLLQRMFAVSSIKE